MRILYTGGSSGGHLFPIIALHKKLKQETQRLNIPYEAYFCGASFFNKEFFIKEGLTAYFITSAKLRRYFSVLNFFDFFKFIAAFVKSLFLVWKIMPDIVFVKGGYDSLPVGITAWLYRIPMIIHESDSIPGLTNKILAKLAVRVAVSFSYTAQFFSPDKTAITGNIVREKPSNIKDIKKELNIDTPMILILGGSQGAKAINELIARSLNLLLNNYFIVLQCGANNYDDLKSELSLVYQIEADLHPNFKLFAFVNEEELANYFYSADLVVSRAGSGSIFEIAQYGKPSILIPLPESASFHQSKNAFLYAREGAAIVLEQNNLTPGLLIQEINNILNNPQLKDKMSLAARNFSSENAASLIIEEILNLTKSQVVNQKPIEKQEVVLKSSDNSDNKEMSVQDRIYSK